MSIMNTTQTWSRNVAYVKKPNWSLLNPSNKMCCPSRKVYGKSIAISLPVLLITSWNETPSIYTRHSDMYPSNSWIPSSSLSISRYWELVFTYGYSRFSKSINPWTDTLLEKCYSLNAINIFLSTQCIHKIMLWTLGWSEEQNKPSLKKQK